jgi:hypothetical protein
MRTAAWGFGEDDDLKAILGQFAALLARQHVVVALTAASLDRVWFVPSLSALFAEFQNRCVVFVASASSSSSLSSPYPSLA